MCVQSDMSWALQKERKGVRFSDDVKSYLSDICLQGENDGANVYPSIVAKNMRFAKNENGPKRMSVGQILSFFQYFLH